MCPFACSCPFPHEGAGGVGYHQDSAYPWLHSMLLGPSIILILQWLPVGIHPMSRNITLIYCNHNLFTVYFCTFLCNPSCFTTRYSLDLLQSFLTDELMDEGIWAVQDDIVDKRACIVWSSYRSSICLLVVLFLLCIFVVFHCFSHCLPCSSCCCRFCWELSVVVCWELVCTVNVSGKKAETTCAICCWWQY